jgi:hypothetical protein
LAGGDWGILMINVSQEDLYRKALETEGGEHVSAGARVAHVECAIESGRAFYVNLSAVPAEKRSALLAEIQELIKRTEHPSVPFIDNSKSHTPNSAS